VQEVIDIRSLQSKTKGGGGLAALRCFGARRRPCPPASGLSPYPVLCLQRLCSSKTFPTYHAASFPSPLPLAACCARDPKTAEPLGHFRGLRGAAMRLFGVPARPAPPRLSFRIPSAWPFSAAALEIEPPATRPWQPAPAPAALSARVVALSRAVYIR
jgi:hypothetical protein